MKGGLSDSMKRAAVQWGIGRVLYNMDVVFVDVEKRGKTWCIKKDQQNRLDNAYLKMLGKLNLTPAPSGGLRPQTQTEPEGTPNGQQPEPQQGQSTDQSTGKFQRVSDVNPSTDNLSYIIRNARINEGINSTSTQLRLESSKGEKLDAFARGAHPELKTGIVLVDVKLEMRQRDTIIYYMLDEFKIADIQPHKAA